MKALHVHQVVSRHKPDLSPDYGLSAGFDMDMHVIQKPPDNIKTASPEFIEYFNIILFSRKMLQDDLRRKIAPTILHFHGKDFTVKAVTE